jgi:predicted ArsR family transcriptional regulator
LQSNYDIEGKILHHTRQQIIEYIKEKGQTTVDDLATVVNLTPMAVRYHLNVLQRDNLISSPAVRRAAGRGRPQQVYALTEAADNLFPVDYCGLADHLLNELTLRLDKEGIDDLFSSIANRLGHEAPVATENQRPEERLGEVMAFLTKKGFVVDWEDQEDYYMIHAYSCPYRQIAKEHKQVCLLDKQIISMMLNSTPTRIACLTSGDSHCTYQIAKPIELIVNPA